MPTPGQILNFQRRKHLRLRVFGRIKGEVNTKTLTTPDYDGRIGGELKASMGPCTEHPYKTWFLFKAQRSLSWVIFVLELLLL